MMKVLIFSTAYFPFVGGAEVAVRELTDRLGSEIEFDLITARLEKGVPSTERIGKVNVYRIGVGIRLVDKLLIPFFGAWKTLELQKKNQYVAYWCIMATFASGAAYIANWFQGKVPVILTLQEGDSEEWLTRRWAGLIDLSWRMALKRTTHLTAISNYLLRRAKKLGYEGEATLLPNGVNINRFENRESKVFDRDNVVLITTSRLVEKNAVGDVIEALKLLPESVSFRVVGTGPLEHTLKARLRKLGVEDRVTFAGFTPQEDIPRHLHHASIFIRPSLSEGQGISFIEAMAAGLPVIATSVGGIPDFLEDSETGVLCRPHDPESIAEAVLKLVENEALRTKIAAQALAMVQEKYDWDLIAEKMKEHVFKPFYT